VEGWGGGRDEWESVYVEGEKKAEGERNVWRVWEERRDS